MTEKQIQTYYDKFVNQKLAKSVYQRYYTGDHDIIRNYAMNNARSNSKVVVNFFRKFVSDEVSYILSNPINYICRMENQELITLLEDNFYWEKIHNQELLLNALIFGEAYEIGYLNNEEYKAMVTTPLNCYVVESGRADKEVVLALHSYNVGDDEFIDIYNSNMITTYSVKDGKVGTIVSEHTHIFPKPPITVLGSNLNRESMLDDIKSLQDSYNSIMSDLCNEISDFRLALLTITGADLGADEAEKLKQDGIIIVPTGADVGYLVKNINDVFVKNTLENIEEKIYTLSNHVNTNIELASNLSGVALRSRLLSLESKCSLIQSVLEVKIKERLRNFFYYNSILTNVFYDFRTVKLKFTPNIPADLTSLSQICVQLMPIVSQRTLLSLLPFVDNVDVELERYKLEQKEENSINLDKIGFTDDDEVGE